MGGGESWTWKPKLTHWAKTDTGARPATAWKHRHATCHIQRVPGSALGDEALSGELGRAGGSIASSGEKVGRAGHGWSGVRYT